MATGRWHAWSPERCSVRRRPLQDLHRSVCVDITLEAGASMPIDADYEERAVYVSVGEVDIAGDRFETGKMMIFRPGDRITLKAREAEPYRDRRRRAARRTSPRLVELRFLASRAHRAGQGRMEERLVRQGAGRRDRIHSVTGEAATRPADRGLIVGLPVNRTGITIAEDLARLAALTERPLGGAFDHSAARHDPPAAGICGSCRPRCCARWRTNCVARRSMQCR